MNYDLFVNIFICISVCIPGYYLGVFDFKRINYYFILFWALVIFCVIGAFFISISFVDNTFFVFPIQRNIFAKSIGLYVVTISFAILIWSIFLLEILFNNLKIKKINWKNYQKIRVEKRVHIGFLFLCSISFFTTIYYLYTIHPSPLFLSVLHHDAGEIAIRRLEVTKFYSGIGYFKTLALTIPIIVSFILFALWFSSNSVSYLVKLIACLSACMVVYILLSNGEKGPVIFYLLGIYTCFNFYKTIKLWIVILILILILIFTLLLYLILFKINNVERIIDLFIERIFIAQVISVFYSTDYFTSNTFLGYVGMNNTISHIFSFNVEPPISETFMHYYLPSMVNNGGWNVNGYFAHETYALFGWYGVVIGSVIAAFYNTLLCIFFRNREKNIVNVGFFVFYSISIITLLTNFSYMLFNTQLVMIFIVFIITHIINRVKV